LITQIIYGEEYRSLSSSLCSSLNYLVTSSLLGPNIFLSTLFSGIFVHHRIVSADKRVEFIGDRENGLHCGK
jgi:hypothetical protein